MYQKNDLELTEFEIQGEKISRQRRRERNRIKKEKYEKGRFKNNGKLKNVLLELDEEIQEGKIYR